MIGVDEHESAGVEHNRPPPGWVGEMVAPDVDGLRRHFAEILNNDASAFSVGAGKDANAAVHPHLRAAITIPEIYGVLSHCSP